MQGPENDQDRTNAGNAPADARTQPAGEAGRELLARAQADAAHADPARRDSGQPGGGTGRVDVTGESKVHPVSSGVDPNRHDQVVTPAAWGQGDRGAAGYNDAGGSELVMRDGQLLGGLTSGPSGEPTIDLNGGDRPPQ